MSMVGKSWRTLCGAAAVCASLTVAAPAGANTIQLGFILDTSGSIGSVNWTTITSDLASAINALIPIGGADTYEVSVVKFSTSAETGVSPTLITSAGVRSTVATAISGTPYLGGTTDYAAAFGQMQTLLTGSANFGGASAQYVNFATDGVPNSQAAAVTARNALIAAGIDNLSIEAIGAGVNATFLMDSICYPGPCDATAPYDFPTHGFYMPVADAAAYAAAINNKILTVTGQIPEPGSIALLGAALGSFGLIRRRRR